MLTNKYSRWYWQLIEKARGRAWTKRTAPEYVEQHHVVPKSICENNDVVCLTYREHFIAHWLLTKFTEGRDRQKMLFALHNMSRKTGNNKRIISSWQYSIGKQAQAEVMRSRPAPMKGRSRPDLKGRVFPSEIAAKISATKRAHPHKMSDEQKKFLSDLGKTLIGEKNPFYGRKHSEEAKQKMREAKRKVAA